MSASHTAVEAFYFSKSRHDSSCWLSYPLWRLIPFPIKSRLDTTLINSIGNIGSFWVVAFFAVCYKTLDHNGVVKYVLESHFNPLIPSILRTKSWSIYYWNMHEISCKIAGSWKCNCDLISNLTPLWSPKLGRSPNILSAKQIEFVKEWVMKSSKILFTFADIPHRSWC